ACAKCNPNAEKKAALIAGFAADGCCAKAAAEGKWCDHPCCTEAVAKLEACAKCNPAATPAADVAAWFDEGSCCAKAVAGNAACAHECCVEAMKAGKPCVKCNPGAEEKLKAKEEAPAANGAEKV